MPIGPAKMSLFEHINELRKRITILVIVISITMAVLYFFSLDLIQLLLLPVMKYLPDGKMYFRSPLEAMMVRIAVSLWGAVIIDSPVIIWQVMGFFLPALKPKERKFVVPTFATMVVLFLAGVTLAYTVVLGPSFSWLSQQGMENGKTIMTYLPDTASLLTVVQFFLIGFGLAFQTPVVVFYLVFFNVLSYSKLRKNWRTVYIVLVAVGCSVTPDFAPITMIALSASMIILYEGSLGVARLVLSKKIKERAAIEAADAAEDARLDEEMKKGA